MRPTVGGTVEKQRNGEKETTTEIIGRRDV